MSETVATTSATDILSTADADDHDARIAKAVEALVTATTLQAGSMEIHKKEKPKDETASSTAQTRQELTPVVSTDGKDEAGSGERSPRRVTLPTRERPGGASAPPREFVVEVDKRLERKEEGTGEKVIAIKKRSSSKHHAPSKSGRPHYSKTDPRYWIYYHRLDERSARQCAQQADRDRKAEAGYRSEKKKSEKSDRSPPPPPTSGQPTTTTTSGPYSYYAPGYPYHPGHQAYHDPRYAPPHMQHQSPEINGLPSGMTAGDVRRLIEKVEKLEDELNACRRALERSQRELKNSQREVIVELGEPVPKRVVCGSRLVVFSPRGNLSSIATVVEHGGRDVRLQYPDGFVTEPISLVGFRYKVLP